MNFVPVGFLHIDPSVVGLEPKVQHPLRLLFLQRDSLDDVLVKPVGKLVALDQRLPPVLVRPAEHLLQLPFLLGDDILLLRKDPPIRSGRLD